jgi:hypothetical protein
MFLSIVNALCHPGVAQCATGEPVDYIPAIGPVAALIVVAIVIWIVGYARQRQRQQ